MSSPPKTFWLIEPIERIQNQFWNAHPNCHENAGIFVNFWFVLNYLLSFCNDLIICGAVNIHHRLKLRNSDNYLISENRIAIYKTIQTLKASYFTASPLWTFANKARKFVNVIKLEETNFYHLYFLKIFSPRVYFFISLSLLRIAWNSIFNDKQLINSYFKNYFYILNPTGSTVKMNYLRVAAKKLLNIFALTWKCIAGGREKQWDRENGAKIEDAQKLWKQCEAYRKLTQWNFW